MGEAFVMAKADTPDLVRKLEWAGEQAKCLNWRIHEIVLVPVTSLPGE